MASVDRTYTGKFTVGQRVRNKGTGYVGKIALVDPHSFNPPRGQAEHYPYRVSYFHWVPANWIWEPESELEAV